MHNGYHIQRSKHPNIGYSNDINAQIVEYDHKYSLYTILLSTTSVSSKGLKQVYCLFLVLCQREGNPGNPW